MPGKFDGDAFSRSDIMRRLADVERDLRALQTARRLEAAAIGAGGLRVHSGGRIVIEDQAGADALVATADGLTLTGPLRVVNANGAVVAQVGQLPDGTHGVAAIDPATGHLVNLSTLAFGIRAVTNNSVLSITATDWDDPAVGDPGPTITDLPIGTSGRCIVILSASLDPGIPEEQVGQLQMGVQVSGASERIPGTGAVLALGRSSSGTGNFDLPSADVANVALMENLNPGLHTLHAQYQNTGAANNSTVTIPTMIAIPF